MKMQRMCLFVAALVATISTGARAGVIQSAAVNPLSPGLGIVTIPLILTSTPGNDNTDNPNANNNISIATKAFEHNDYIDIVFNVVRNGPLSGAGSATEYRVVETVDNATGVNWSSYTMQLGFGTGGAFVSSTSGDGLDFDTPNNDPVPTSGIMPSVSRPTEDSLLYFGGIHAAIQHSYDFHLDVPNFGEAPYQFTIRQAPVAVPEPGTLALLGLTLLCVVGDRRSR
jgi:hypothetical protein